MFGVGVFLARTRPGLVSATSSFSPLDASAAAKGFARTAAVGDGFFFMITDVDTGVGGVGGRALGGGRCDGAFGARVGSVVVVVVVVVVARVFRADVGSSRSKAAADLAAGDLGDLACDF